MFVVNLPPKKVWVRKEYLYYLRKGHFEKNSELKATHYTKAKNYYDEAIKYVEEKMLNNIFPYYTFLYNYSDLFLNLP